MIDFYRTKYKNKSETELRKIAVSPEFQKEAVIAAVLELKERNLNIDDFQDELSELQTEVKQGEEEKKKDGGLISKTIIYLVGFLLNPLFAAIPYVVNLITAKRSKFIWEAIGFTIVFTILNLYVMNLLNWYFGAVIISNALGTVIITELLWKRHLSNLNENEG